MSDSFFFYDLETSGISSRRDRIMQFAGQRTDLNLKPVGKPFDQLVKLSPDILPEPEAIMLTGISPYLTASEGISEAEFAAIFNHQVAVPGTIFVGYNNLRFDDEFIRFLNYRNFYDAYAWHWKDGSSRWDLLDLVRMTRALRPEGINWPLSDENKPTNRLELLTKANNLSHDSAHDALSDVEATIELAGLLKAKQPKLFDFLLNTRQKDQILKLISADSPFVYTSSHYSSSVLHTTLVGTLDINQDRSSALVYDLRYDPDLFINLSPEELVSRWKYDPEATEPRLPVKTMKFNRCPAVAPANVLNEDCYQRLSLDKDLITVNFKKLMTSKAEFSQKLKQVVLIMDKDRDDKQTKASGQWPSVDQKLYDKFIPKSDQLKFEDVRNNAKNPSYRPPQFEDKRLGELYLLYRARNYPDALSVEELEAWHSFVKGRLFSAGDGLSNFDKYMTHLSGLKETYKTDKKRLELLEDLTRFANLAASDYAAD